MLDLEKWKSTLVSHMAVSVMGHSTATFFDSMFIFRVIIKKEKSFIHRNSQWVSPWNAMMDMKLT